MASERQWQFLPILFWAVCFLWQMIPVMLASLQEQFDLGILLRFPVSFWVLLPAVRVSSGWRMSPPSWARFAALASGSESPSREPDLFAWAAMGLVVFALFNILLVRAIFAWIDRWLAQRKTREIVGALFMVLLLSLQLLNPALHPNRRQASLHSGKSDMRTIAR